MEFKLATRRNLYVRILVDGVAGSGKTTTSLLIARGLVGPDGRVGMIDTQNRQSLRYADRHRFGVIHLRRDYHPETFVAAIQAAEAQSIECLIIDSASSEWDGVPNGVLDLTDRAKNSWKDTTPLHNLFIDAILQFKGHVILACKTKTAWEYRPNERGKIIPNRVGTDIVQRPGFEYGVDLWLRLDISHTASVEKSVFDFVPQGSEIDYPSQDIGEQIAAWAAGEPVQPPAGTVKRRPVDDNAEDDVAAEEMGEGSQWEPSTDGEKDDTEGYDYSEELAAAKAEAEEEGSHEHDARETADDPDEPFGPMDALGTDALAEQRAATAVNGRPAAQEPAIDATATRTPPVADMGTPVQCDVCGDKIFPGQVEMVGENRIKGSVLIKRTQERFRRVLCVKHWLVEQKKQRQRNPQRSGGSEDRQPVGRRS